MASRGRQAGQAFQRALGGAGRLGALHPEVGVEEPLMNLVLAWFLATWSTFSARFVLMTSIIVQVVILVALLRFALYSGLLIAALVAAPRRPAVAVGPLHGPTRSSPQRLSSASMSHVTSWSIRVRR